MDIYEQALKEALQFGYLMLAIGFGSGALTSYGIMKYLIRRKVDELLLTRED